MSVKYVTATIHWTYLVLPGPERAAVLDAFAFDDLDHGCDGLLSTDDALDFPTSRYVLHVTATVSEVLDIAPVILRT